MGTAEKGAESSADGHDQGGKEPTLAPPQPQRRARVSPFVLHPEVPNADRHEYHITDDALGVGTPGERFNNNVRAIRLLKRLEAEDRLATPEEQEVLARYVGWGGLADCFDERHSKYAELKALLTEEEYAAARESTLTAFYTPPVVIRSIYQALTNMGFQTGNLLEPSCGIGNFIGMRPEALADSKIYGVELDGISGRIAQQLYQQSSIAVQGFEKTDLPDSFFDAAIGNVPFGSFKVIDKRYDRYNFLIHDYFFARTLDKVRPGGVIAFVTSKGTMDKDTPTVRKYLAQRADLLGAIRLPNNTFKDAAGTDVTSDILFLQKRDALSSEEPDWVHLNTDANGLKMNQYFIDHPEMVMGEMREISGPYGPETACLPIEGRDLGEQLAAAIQNIRGSITEYVMDDPEIEGEDKSIPADPEVRNFSYTITMRWTSIPIYLNELDVFMAQYAQTFRQGNKRRINPAYKKPLDKRRGKQEWLKRNESKISPEQKATVMAEINEINQYLRTIPYVDPMDDSYKRLVYVRYADDFLIGVIGSKADARQVKIDVGMFIREQLHLELSQEKTLITHGTDFAQFLSFQITTSKEQNSTRTKAGYVKRSYTGRIKLYVPKEKWLKRLLSYGALKIHYDKDNGNKEIWEPVCRSSLRNLDDLEILNQYNAEIRGLYNYYRIAHNATVLNNFLYVMKYSMYKTFAGKYRTSMQKIIRKYTRGKDFVVTYQSKSGEKSVVFYNQGMRRDTHVDATNPDIIGRANENRSYTSLVQRLKGGQCEWCGATDVEIEIHHIRKLKDLSGKAEWERHMIARRRKTMALCHNCHVKLHAGKLD